MVSLLKLLSKAKSQVPFASTVSLERCLGTSSKLAQFFRDHEGTGETTSTPSATSTAVMGQAPQPGRRILPLMTSRELPHLPPGKPSKQAWLESMDGINDEKLGIVDLHPDVFGTFPRVDILWWNVHWQKLYRKINYDVAKSRAELKGGGRKPWQQKGTGRARHGSIRSPLFVGGGKTFGPRGPKSYFFMLPQSMRVLGLRVALSVKYAQNNLHIVDSLEIPTDEPEYIENLIELRGWGLSVLFVDDTDVLPRNFAQAVDGIPQYNAMPVYGLNVYSMLKHESLVLTLAAVERLEERLLFHMNKQEHREPVYKHKSTYV